MPNLATTAAEAIALLAASLHPLAIVWFGSASRGEDKLGSDLDFLVVASRDAGGRDDLFMQAQRAIWHVRAPIDVLIYYADEVEAKRGSLGSVVREALETGRVVHGHV